MTRVFGWGAVTLLTAALSCFAGAIYFGHNTPTGREATVKVEIVADNTAETPTMGHGSGVVIGEGLMLTARHVVDNAPALRLRFEGQTVPGHVVWVGHGPSMANDLALVRFDPSTMTNRPRALSINCHTIVHTDAPVEIFGHPMYMGLTRTTGTIGSYMGNVLVVDATIGPGNSGGPIVFQRELVGLAVAAPVASFGFFSASILSYTFGVSQSSICRALNIPVAPMPDDPQAPSFVVEPIAPRMPDGHSR